MDQDDDQYRWESATGNAINQNNRRKELAQLPNVRLGMMRHRYVVLDMSDAMKDQDLRPNRLFCSIELLKEFIFMYFDSNPTIPNRLNNHTKETYQECEGEASIQTALEMGLQTLKHMPKYSSREMLFVLGCLTTCDPANILQTLKICKENEIRCSVISLSAEVRVFRKLCVDTKGIFHVIMDSTLDKFESSLVRMDFPKYRTYTTSNANISTTSSNSAKHEKASMCMCHLEQRGGINGFSIGDYFCPTCESKYWELPTECSICHLRLVSAPHLARSYHFLFPIEQFIEVTRDELPSQKCFACQHAFDEQKHKSIFKCTSCNNIFCFECDLFIHGTIFTCPGCIRYAQLK
ncbi:unnamed protein product [Rotaria socialis]